MKKELKIVKTNITRQFEKMLERAKNPAYRLRQAILKKREQDKQNIKSDLGI